MGYQAKENTMNRTWTVIIIAIASAALVGGLAGCDFGDLIRVQTPRNIQRTEALPTSMTLNDSREEYENWINAARNDSMRWRANIERADELNDLFAGFVLQGLEDVGPSIAGIPMASTLLPLLTGGVGLFLRRPGDKTQKDVDEAWDEAFEAGKGAA